MRKLLIIFTSILLTSVLVTAQNEPSQPAPPTFPYESAHAIVKYDCTMVDLAADGRSNTLRHYRIALMSDRAIREYAQDITTYNTGYDTVDVLAAKVHLPSGEIVDVESDAIKDVPVPAFGKFFLQNVREKIITFPQLRQGAEIEVAYREITREAPMDSHFDMVESFQTDDPIQVKYVEVAAPKGMDLRWKARGGSIPYQTASDEDKTIHLWNSANIAQLVPEPGMPPGPEVVKMLLISTVQNWQTWSKWYAELCESEMSSDVEIHAKVEELTRGKLTAAEKLSAIFYFISNDIRYVETALSGRKAGYKPESASVTLRNKYGVCRDKAALMVAMLREAGIPADIALMNPSWKIDGDIPADQFNHAIVAAYVDGKKILVDPTVEKTKDYLAANEQDRAVLVCNRQGEDLEWTPVEPSEQNLFQIHATSTLEDNGLFTSNIIIQTYGYPDLVLRNFLQGVQPDRREQIFKRMIQRVHPTAILDSLTIPDLMDFSRNVEIKLQLHAKDYSILAGKFLLFGIPNQAEGLDFLSRSMLSGSQLAVRRFDLRLSSTFSVRAEETVSYPSGWTVRSLPEKVNLDYGDFHLARDFAPAKNKLTVRRVLDFSTLNISLSQYNKLQELLRKSELMTRGKVVLVKT